MGNDPKEKLTERVDCNFTASGVKELDARAAAAGMDRSNYIRYMTIGAGANGGLRRRKTGSEK